MEKIIYPLWKSESVDLDKFNAALLTDCSKELLANRFVSRVKVCVIDEYVVEKKDSSIVNLFAQPVDAVLILWVNSAYYHLQLLQIILNYCELAYAYHVTESEILLSDHGSDGTRNDGFNQLAFLRQPERLAYEEWRSIWLSEHTDVAIKTQSTFGYRQNLVVRALMSDAPKIHAVVEENFPLEALNDPKVFFDARDESSLKANELKLMNSCARFIDFDQLDCYSMSEYGFK